MLTLMTRNLCSQAALELKAILHLGHPSAGITAICYSTWLNALTYNALTYKLTVFVGSGDKPHLVYKQLQCGSENKSAKANTTLHMRREAIPQVVPWHMCIRMYTHIYKLSK